jgi:hypothetical protein
MDVKQSCQPSNKLPCVLTAVKAHTIPTALSARLCYLFLQSHGLRGELRQYDRTASQLTHDIQKRVLHALQFAAASCAGLLPALLAKALSTASSAPRQHSALQATSATAPCRTGPRPHVPCMAPQVASAVSWPTQSSPLTLLQGPLQAQQPLL